jgi:hypothetical protein
MSEEVPSAWDSRTFEKLHSGDQRVKSRLPASWSQNRASSLPSAPLYAIALAVFGGLPAGALIPFVGCRGAPIKVLLCGNRVVLNNGFHRVHALRSIGVMEIPVVMQQVRIPNSNFRRRLPGCRESICSGLIVRLS